jgi:hypothetical protein
VWEQPRQKLSKLAVAADFLEDDVRADAAVADAEDAFSEAEESGADEHDTTAEGALAHRKKRRHSGD